MGCYNEKSKEELLAVIEELEAQLREAKGVSVSKDESDFREKYAMRVLNALTDKLFVLDHNGVVVETLSRVEDYTSEIFPAKIINTPLEELVPADVCASLKETMQQMLDTGKTAIGEHALLIDDTLHYFEHTISALDDDFLLCVCRDISLRITQQREISRLNTLLNTMLNNISVYMFVKDAGNDFRYLYWNQAFADHAGIYVEDAIGKNDHELFRDMELMDRFRKEDLEVLEKGRIEYEEETVTASGERLMMITVKTVINSDTDNPYIIGISWDTTEIRKAEKKLIEARVKAEEADKLKSSFLANMSHEIRTPLNAIVGFSKLAIEAKDEEEKWGYVDIVDTNTKLLLSLFNDILDLSAIESDSLSLSLRPVFLRELCTDQYDKHCHTTKYGVTLILDDVDAELWITADWDRLGQVITNLLNNAIKFTQEGEVHFGFERKGDSVQFYVKDTGIGISGNKISTIFHRFGKVNNFVQGTGLGLALSRMLVEKMGGRIWARSKVGQGSTFYFTLPFDQTIG